jgi:hypothetical protein
VRKRGKVGEARSAPDSWGKPIAREVLIVLNVKLQPNVKLKLS